MYCETAGLCETTLCFYFVSVLVLQMTSSISHVLLNPYVCSEKSQQKTVYVAVRKSSFLLDGVIYQMLKGYACFY